MQCCPLCRHAHREEIDAALAQGAWPAELAARFNVSPLDALIHRRHQPTPAPPAEESDSFMYQPQMHPEAIRYRRVVITALENYPEAFQAVLEAVRREYPNV